MTEEFPFEPGALEDGEIGIEKSLRPRSLDEFIGQRRVIENLRIAIEASKTRQEPLDHVLFSGMPGLGKTTLSYLISNALDVRLHQTSGPVLEKGKDIAGILTRLEHGDVLFIDEIHRMSRAAEEILYPAMEDFRVEVVLDAGADARVLNLQVAPFTLVGATTREGFLSAPFRSRFGIVEKLELYPPDDLFEIIKRSADLLDCSIPESAGDLLSRRCRGTPRYANRFLRRIRDVAQCRTGWTAASGRLDLSVDYVNEGLARLGVDENGLDRTDRKILQVLLSQNEPVGVKTLAVSVGEEERTIEDVYEPYLIQHHMLVKTPRGRRASARAAELYPPERLAQSEQQEFSF